MCPALFCSALCRKEILANDGVAVIVRSCRWRPHDAAFRPKQEVGAGLGVVVGLLEEVGSCRAVLRESC